MLGVKVELNASSVAETKRKFGELLTNLQDRANRTTIKINVDLANLRQLNGMMNTVINDMRRVDAQNKQSAKTMQQMTDAMRDMLRMQGQLNGTANNGNGNGGHSGMNMGLGTLAEWLLIRKGIQMAMNSLQEGVKFTVDMNKAMTEISIVTGMNQRQVGQLAVEYNKLAKAMAVSTDEVAKASVEYYRQGLSTQEVNNRMEQTIQYAKVSGMALEEASTVLTATVNSMDIDIKRASDVFAYLGDATATGADEIGRAFQKVGGTASALGVNFEKVSSWIATISSKTREGAETIGNSIKNVMARYQQVRERGFTEEDGTDINQVSKALAEVGIKIVDAKGQFVNFGNVMDELGGKWKNLDSKHKAYIATTLAGTNQQSRFLNLMENYGESVDLYKNSLESAGATQNKYNLYMQGTEARLNQLRATGQGVWLKIFNNEDMQTAIEALTSLVEGVGWLVDKLGAVPAIVGTASVALGLFSKQYTLLGASTKNAIQLDGTVVGRQLQFYGRLGGAVENLIKKQVELHNTMNVGNEITMQELTWRQQLTFAYTGLRTQIASLTPAMIGARLGALALSASMAVLQGVLTMGISVAITAVVGWITHLINAEKEAKEKLDQLNSSYQQNIEANTGNIRTLSGLRDEFEQLTAKVSKTADEQKRLNDISNQIAQISPSVVDGYDAQGNAIIRNKDAVDQLIKSYQQANELENSKIMDKFDDTYKTSMKPVNKTMKEYSGLDAEIGQFKKEKEALEEGLKVMKEQKYTKEEIAYREQEIANKQEAINIRAERMKGLYADASTELKTGMTTSFRVMLQENERFGSTFKNNADAMKVAMNMLTDVNFMKNKGWSDVEPELEKIAKSGAWSVLKNKINDLNKQFKQDNNLYAYKQGLREIAEQTAKSLNIKGLNTDELITWLEEMYKVPPAITQAKNSVSDMEQAVKALTNAFGQATTNIEDYNKYIDELNDKNVLSATSVKDIMEKHKELIIYLGNEGELRKKLAELIQNEEQVQQDAYVGMLEMSEQFYNEKVKGSGLLQDKLGEYYTSDLENYKSLAEMKSAVDSKLIQELSKQWGDYFSVTADGMLAVDNQAYTDIVGEDGALNTAKVRQLNKLNADIESARAKLKDVSNRFKSITLTIAPINFDKINLSKTTSGKGGGSESTSYESKLDGMDKFTAYLDDINQQLEKQDDLISDIADKAKLYKDAGDRKSLLEALKLETDEYTEQARKLATLKQDIGLVNAQQAVLAQTFKKNWSAMSGADLSSWTRTDFNKMFEQLFPTKTFKNKSQQEAYENQKKYFSTLVDDWFKYADQVKSINNDILSTQNDMLQLMQDRYDTYFKVIEGDLKAVTNSIDDIKNSMDMLSENEEFDKREEYAQQLIAKTTTYRDTIEQTITVLTNHRNTLQQGSAEWTIVNDQIKEYEKTLQSANKDLKDASDLIAQIQQQELDTASNLQDKIVDALRNKYNKAKEAELDAVEKKKQADLDKANAELEQLKKELADLQDETQSKKDQLAKEKAELELWKKDNSAYAQGKVRELEASIKQHEKELAIDAKQKEIDDKQKEIDTINDTADKEEKRIEDHYKTLLDDQALYAEALKIMETQSQDEILELLKSYDEKYAELGTTLGKAYADALMAEIKKGQDALKAMQDGVAPVVTPDKPTETPAPPTTPTTPPPIAPPATPPAPPSAPTSTASIAWDGHYYQKGSYGDVVKRIQQNLNAIGYNLVVDGAFGTNTRNAIVDFQRKNGLSADGIVGQNTWGKLIKFDTGGYTGDWGGSGRLAVLHEKERVLNQSQTRAFEYLIYDILPKFYNQTAMSKLNSVASVIFNEPVVKNDIHIINNTPFDVENNMDNLNKAIRQELKQAGFRINLVR